MESNQVSYFALFSDTNLSSRLILSPAAKHIVWSPRRPLPPKTAPNPHPTLSSSEGFPETVTHIHVYIPSEILSYILNCCSLLGSILHFVLAK